MQESQEQHGAAGTPLAPTPRLESLLTRLRANLTRMVWLHGVGTLFAVTTGWLVFAFFADVILHVPKAVRWFHFALLLGIPVFFFWRDLLTPLRRRPDRAGLGVLVERAYPESKELVISAIQLARTEAASPSAPLVRAVLGQADELAAELDLKPVLDSRPVYQRLSLGLGCTIAACMLFLMVPGHSSIFFQRLVGRDVSWPQRTQLSVEIPVAGDHDRIQIDENEIFVRVARGSDVPVIIRAEGVVPDEVRLEFDGGHTVILASTGGEVFRTLLRSCQEDLEFSVTGGDDQDGLPRVRLKVLQPPDVAGIAVRIEPPVYSELPMRLEFDRDVEVISGSKLTVHMLPEPIGATGFVRLLPEDRKIELVPAPYPRREDPFGDEEVGEGEAPTSELIGRSFEFVAMETLRYQFELEDASGLPNPDPGLFAIHVIEDRAPDVSVLSPGRGDVDTILGGALSLRVRAEDDFGLDTMRWSASDGSSEDQATAGGLLEWEPIAVQRPAGEGGRRLRAAGLGVKRLYVEDLTTDKIVEGQQFTIRVDVDDNRMPEAQTAQSIGVRVRVVSSDEFMRRVQDRLSRVRLQASALGELQREKLGRTQELIASLASDQPADGTEASDLASALTGQRRVLGDAEALSRELGSIVETVLYSRIDERGEALFEAIDPLLSAYTDRSFHAEAWQELVTGYDDGQYGAAGLSGKLVEILGLGLAISETHAFEALQALALANDAADLSRVHENLTGAGVHQARTLTEIESLLERLSEWENFQSILTLTRDILNRQKNLTERTRQFAKDN